VLGVGLVLRTGLVFGLGIWFCSGSCQFKSRVRIKFIGRLGIEVLFM
jgi:hypothetical protein